MEMTHSRPQSPLSLSDVNGKAFGLRLSLTFREMISELPAYRQMIIIPDSMASAENYPLYYSFSKLKCSYINCCLLKYRIEIYRYLASLDAYRRRLTSVNFTLLK